MKCTEPCSLLDLNGSHFDTIDALPSALEFSQLVRIARPVVIKGMNYCIGTNIKLI